MSRQAVRVQGIPPNTPAKQVAGRDRAFWQRLFSHGNSPAAKTVEAPLPSVAMLHEGDMGAIRRCIEDDGIWRKVGMKAIDKGLIASLCPEDARDVFVCLVKNQPRSDKFFYFLPGQIKPELFSEQQALDVANALLKDRAETRDRLAYGWLLGKESFASMQPSVRRAVLFRLMEGPWLMGFEGVAGAEWGKFGPLTENELKHACWSAGHENWHFFTHERRLLFELEDMLKILASAIRHKKEGALERARSFYRDKAIREEIFKSVVKGRVYSEGMEGNVNRGATTVMTGLIGGMLLFPTVVAATLSVALDMTFKELMNSGGERIFFFGVFVGAVLGLMAGEWIDGALTRWKVRRSERKELKKAMEEGQD